MSKSIFITMIFSFILLCNTSSLAVDKISTAQQTLDLTCRIGKVLLSKTKNFICLHPLKITAAVVISSSFVHGVRRLLQWYFRVPDKQYCEKAKKYLKKIKHLMPSEQARQQVVLKKDLTEVNETTLEAETSLTISHDKRLKKVKKANKKLGSFKASLTERLTSLQQSNADEKLHSKVTLLLSKIDTSRSLLTALQSDLTKHYPFFICFNAQARIRDRYQTVPSTLAIPENLVDHVKIVSGELNLLKKAYKKCSKYPALQEKARNLHRILKNHISVYQEYFAYTYQYNQQWWNILSSLTNLAFSTFSS